MQGEKILTIVFLLLPYCLFVCEWIISQKTINKLYDECNNYCLSNIAKTQKEIMLKEIIINSKKTKENFFETLEKIEKELFK